MTTLLNIAVTDGDGVRLLENRLSGKIHLRYALTDHLGSIGGETDTHGNIISREEYYSFGGSAGGDEEAGEITDRTRRYSGKERDATGLLYYDWRYYQPGAGRWLSADPGGLIDGANLFRFCRNNPTNLRDTDGRIPDLAEVTRLATLFSIQPRDELNGRLMAGWQIAPLPQACDYTELAWSLLSDVEAGNIAATALYAGWNPAGNRRAETPPLPASVDLGLFETPPTASLREVDFLQPNTLMQFQAAKTGRYACTLCENSYRWKGNLNKHMLDHQGDKPYICTICADKFTRKGSLQRHIINHTKEKSYKCSYCDKLCSQKSNLDSHMRLHTGEKPYTCPFCYRPFRHSQQLTEHMRTHTKERPYPCTTCGASFVRSNDLKTHMNVHTGAKPFVCATCSKAYTNPSNLRRHVRNNH